jgi:hypothetical protein
MRWAFAFPLALVVCTAGIAQDKKDDSSRFKQYVGVYTRHSAQQLVLKNPAIRQLGDRSFLVGTPVDVEENATRLTARSGVVWWVGLSEVTEFYEFDDARGYRFDGKPAR